MANNNKVVWSEGLFLRTQHFQQQDRHTEWLVRQSLRATSFQCWGFSALRLDGNALEAGLVGIEQGAGIFPDGTPFAIPDISVDVAPVPISAKTDAGLVSLALPVTRADATQIDPAHGDPSGTRLRGEIVSVKDAIRGGAEAADVEIARLAPKLLLPGDTLDGYTSLPIARIDGLDADSGVILDDSFLAPALQISAMPGYGEFLKEMITGLNRIAEAHGGIVLDGTGASMENLLILELANTLSPRLAHILTQNNLHPSELFRELSSMAGRMATYGSSSRRLSELPAYDHRDPQPALDTLKTTLRSLVLSLRHVEPSSRSLEVKRHADNIWTIRIDNPDLIANSRIVLRIGSEMSDEMMRKIFVNQATVGSADDFDDLWTSKLPGIALKPLHSQPREIPFDGERLCLELDRASPHWSMLADAPGFVLGVAGKLEREPDIDCYAVSR